MATSVCAVLGCAFSVVGLLLNIVSVGTTHWLNAEGYLKMDIGLFQHCDYGNDYCGGMEEINAIVDAQAIGWFRAVQATFLLGCLGTLLTCVLDLLIFVRFFNSKGTYKVISAVNICTFFCESFSILLFGLYYKEIFVITEEVATETGLGYSFYVAIVAVIFLFLGFVFHAMEASQAAQVLRNMQHRLTVWSTPYTLFVEQEQ